MYYIKDTGYVIKRSNTQEADKYVTILTQNNGKIDVLAKGIRKLASKRAPQLELLNKISFQAVAKSPSARFVLTEVKLIKNYTALKTSLGQMSVLFTICELVSVLCPQGDRQEKIFFLIDKTLGDLKTQEHVFVIQSFQINLLSTLGFWDARHAFVDSADVQNFTESVMERKIKSSEFFKE